MFWRICLLHTVCPAISVPITDRSLLPNHYASGSKMLVCRHNTSSPAVLGRTGIVKVLTVNCEIIFLMVKFLQPCKKLKFSLKLGENITTQGVRIARSAADHLHH